MARTYKVDEKEPVSGLAANSELLVAIKNVAGQAKDIGIVVDGYEVS